MPTPVGAVLRRTRPNAICIPNRAFYRTHVSYNKVRLLRLC